jgi:hypothetical protein
MTTTTANHLRTNIIGASFLRSPGRVHADVHVLCP